MIRNNPSTSVVIAWNQVSGDSPLVYYGTIDHNTNFGAYEFTHKPDRVVFFKQMHNHFARIKNLKPNTVYYFVIKDSEGTSERFWFKTAPGTNERLSFIAGGDSRNNREARRNANRMVAKLKPHAILFGGDMTSDDNDEQWQTWMDDWQLTIADDNRIFPLIAARGNHERSNNTIYNLFDTPSEAIYYAITFGKNLIRCYTLNTEISIEGKQTEWLQKDLKKYALKTIWKTAQYHKPIRPHVARKREGTKQYENWAPLFYQHKVKFVVECDAHTVKTTWPIKPSTESGNVEGFVRDNSNGTTYVGEGCWGAPLRPDNDVKRWTRNSGKFNQVKWIFVDEDHIECRTVKVANAMEVYPVSNEDTFHIPSNLDIWSPSNGAVVTIHK